MNIYLAIITTVLVLTQIVRVTQNAISLRRQRKKIDETLDWIRDNDISERDFETQREVFCLLREELRERQMHCVAQKKEIASEAADAIEELSKPRWVPVTERLPEKMEWVLVRSKLVKMRTDFISNEGNWNTTPGVTHWMPLPKEAKT